MMGTQIFQPSIVSIESSIVQQNPLLKNRIKFLLIAELP